LLQSDHEVVALITRPDRPIHGKSRAEANPMRAVAEARSLEVHAPEDINAPSARAVVASYRPELLVVCDYGQILSSAVLEIARLGGINLHASLLPKYRGAAPIQWAVYHGEQETGVTVIHMTPRLDAGPAIVQVRTPIGPTETAAELEPRLAELGATAVLEAIAALQVGTALPIEQDQALATRAPRLQKALGEVDWSRTARQIVDQVRALTPWPKTHTFWQRAEAEPLRLILEGVHAEPISTASGSAGSAAATPGTLLEASGERIVVATGAGALVIDRLQPSGKRVLTAAEFMRGYTLRTGDRFGA
jgi:methionyl-tRNA formyltransferase